MNALSPVILVPQNRNPEAGVRRYRRVRPNPGLLPSSTLSRMSPRPTLTDRTYRTMQGQRGLDVLSGASEYLRNNPIKSADMSVQDQDPNRPRKRRRAALACEQCRQRKLK